MVGHLLRRALHFIGIVRKVVGCDVGHSKDIERKVGFGWIIERRCANEWRVGDVFQNFIGGQGLAALVDVLLGRPRAQLDWDITRKTFPRQSIS